MIKYILAFLLVLSACSDVMSPRERGIKLTDCMGDSSCDPYVPPVIGVINQSKAMFTAQYLIEDAYEVDFGNLSLEATVYWADTICPKDGLYKIIYGSECNYGRMWSCDEMYVALSNKNSERTCGSALVHEFGHCLYMDQIDPYHTGCPDHSDTAFWNIIDGASTIACNRGW